MLVVGASDAVYAAISENGIGFLITFGLAASRPEIREASLAGIQPGKTPEVSSRKKGEGIHVTGTHHGEVALIERRDFGDGECLRNCYH